LNERPRHSIRRANSNTVTIGEMGKRRPLQTSMKEPFGKDQQCIGWDRMMDGWLMHKWNDHQE